MKNFEETDMQDIDIYNEIKDFILDLYSDDERTKNDIARDEFIRDKLNEMKIALEDNRKYLLLDQINTYTVFNHVRSDLEVGLSTGIENDIVDQLKGGLSELLEHINTNNTEATAIKESLETIETISEKFIL